MTKYKRYTPGPWVKNEYGELMGANGKRVHEYDSGISAMLAGHTQEHIANATVRNAAPELVEALEDALQTLLDTDVVGENHPAVTGARAALARAYGETAE